MKFKSTIRDIAITNLILKQFINNHLCTDVMLVKSWLIAQWNKIVNTEWVHSPYHCYGINKNIVDKKKCPTIYSPMVYSTSPLYISKDGLSPIYSQGDKTQYFRHCLEEKNHGLVHNTHKTQVYTFNWKLFLHYIFYVYIF